MQFFVEGYELDVQDPTFFMDEDLYKQTHETLDEMLTTYVEDVQMAE